jgi:general secretion pathway protein D
LTAPAASTTANQNGAAVPVSAANPLGRFPGPTPTSGRSSGGAGVSTSGEENISPARPAGILSDENFRTALHALESRPGVVNLGEPEVTTHSGRQTQMRATVVLNIITNLVYVTNGASAFQPQLSQVETGPVLDAVANVLADGYTINLAATPSITQFLGYDTLATNEVLNADGRRVTVTAVLPRFNVQQVVAKMNIYDGQTIVLGGMIKTNYSTTKDKVPVLGDLPVIGRAFRSESKSATKSQIIVFITANIVDSAGNRVNTDEQMPFAKDKVPPQPQPSPQ